MNTAILAVFIMGLRHGADPDHLAAIDNLTRNAYDSAPRASRLVGTFFALGHSAMVLAIAALASIAGSNVHDVSGVVGLAGRIASIAVLLLMAGLNIVALVRGTTTTVRSRLLPKILRDATHPLVAIPTGALFGFGFETSSQLVAYGAAFSSAHLIDGFSIGSAFCLGMICTDTFDSVFVARVVAAPPVDAQRARRPWIAAVTLVAFAVAVEEIFALVGYAAPVDELTLSGMTVLLLIATAVYVMLRNRPYPKGRTNS